MRVRETSAIRLSHRRPRGAAAGILLGLAAVAAVPAAPARGALPVEPDLAVESRVDSLVRLSVELIYRGRLDLADAAIDEAQAIAPGDPRVHLFRYRILRENFPDDVHEQERARARAPILNESLDAAIALCDSIIDAGEAEAAGYLYRGWAHMMKAQNQAIAGHYWSAAGESRRGKGDFDRFYDLHPAGDPDADTIVGGYLYFADVLPGYLKLLKWIIRVPGGDRERGLEMLRSGVNGGGYTKIDAELVLAVINYVFEGRIDRTAESLHRLVGVYPYNPRVVEFLGSMALLFPESLMESIAIETRVIDDWGREVRGWSDIYLLRMRWSRARLLHQAGLYAEARADLETIRAAGPEHPYWIMPRALIGLIGLEASLGRQDSTDVYCRQLFADDRYADYRDAAKKICDVRPAPNEVAIYAELGPAREALYSGQVEEARQLLERINAAYGRDVHLRFVEGELERRSGRLDEAAAAYGDVVAHAGGDGIEPLRMVALLRLGELHIDRREFDAAKKAYEEARELESQATLLGNMIRGRLRFIEEMKG